MNNIIKSNRLSYALNIYLNLLTICLFFTTHKSFAQTTGSDAALNLIAQSSFYVCEGDAPNTLRITNNGSSTMSNVRFSLDLPTGSKYTSGSVSSSPSGVTEFNITNLNTPIFNLPNINAGSYLDLTYNQFFDCSVIPFQSSGGLTKDVGVLLYTLNGTNYTQNLDPASTYNVRAASLNVINVTNSAYSGTVGSSFTQTVTIRNGGLGYTSSIELDLGTLGGVSVSAPNKGTLTGNKINLNSTDMPGGNNRLDTDEDLTVSYTVTINSCNNLSRNITAKYGCNSQNCQTSSNYPVGVSIANSTPNLSVVANWTNGRTDCFEAEEPVVLTITNTGSGPANNISVWISSGTANLNSGSDYISWLISNEFEYSTNGGSSWTTVTVSGEVAHSRTGAGICTPSNAISGFNAAIPGFLLSSGSSFLVRGKLHNCRILDANACTPSTTNYGKMAYRTNYSNQCGNTISTGNSPLIAINSPNEGNTTSAFIYNEVPGSVAANTYAILQFKLKNEGNTRNVSNNFGEIEWTIPSGLTYNGNTGDLTVVNPYNGNTMPILSGYPQLVGNKLTIRYNAETSTTVDVVLRLLNNCSGVGNSNVSIPMAIRTVRNSSCPTSFAYGAMACQTLNTYLLCPGNACATGGFAIDMSSVIKRGTLGLPDNNQDGLPDASGNLDLSKIQLHRYAEADDMSFNLKVNVSTGTINSFAYGGLDLTLNGNDFVSNGNATISIYDISTTTDYTCFAPVTLGASSVAVNFGACAGLPSGFTYQNGDSLRIQFLLKIKQKNGSTNPLVHPSNPSIAANSWGANVANPNSGQKYSCVPYFYNYNIYSQGYTTNAGSSSTAMNGCGEHKHGMRLNTYEYTGTRGNAFPFEYRVANRLDSVFFTLSDDVLFANKITLTLQKAVGNGVTDYILPASAYTVSGKYIAVSLANVWNSTPELTLSTGAPVYGIYAHVTPKCSLPANFSGVSAPVHTDIWYSRYRVTSVGSPQTVNVNDITTSGSFTKPLNLSSSQPNLSVTTNTAQWNVALSNSTPTSAYNTYMYFKKKSPFTNVTLKDLSTNTILTPNANGFYLIGTLNASSTKNYQVSGTMNSCSQESVELAAGWSCNSYPSNVNESLCEQTITLQAQGEISSMDALFDFIPNAANGKVNLCSQVDIESTINSTLIGGLQQVNYTVNLPTGLNYVSGSVQYSFPASGSYNTVSYNPVQSGRQLTFNVNQIAAALNNGLGGVNSLSTKSVKIKFKAETICGFVSGVTISANFGATSPCGATIPVFNKTSLPINVAGASAGAAFAVSVTGPTTLGACATPRYNITVSARNNGVDNSVASDSIIVVLPEGITYGLNSAVTTGGIDPVNLQPIVSGKYLKWAMPVGTPPNSTVNVAFKIIADVAQCSATNVINAYTTQNVPIMCGAVTCATPVKTGSTTRSMTISKANISFGTATMNVTPIANNKERVNVIFTAQNLSGDTLRGTSIVNIINDANSNGSYQNGETVISQVGIPFGLLPNASRTINHTFEINAGSCNLLLKIDEASNTCNCSLAEKAITVNNYNASGSNASLSTCPNGTLTLGTAPLTGYTYTWSSVGAAPIGYLSATNVAQPVLTPLVAGTYSYQLLVNKGGGCIVKDTVTINVGNIPSPAFVGLGTSYCENSSPVTLAANPTGGTFTIDGNPATIFDPKTLSLGNHTIGYTFNNGCTASTSQVVSINTTNVNTGGGFNSQGVPNNTSSNTLAQSLIDNVNATIPETYPAPVYNPQLVNSNAAIETHLEQSTNLSVTFMKEGAGFTNTLAYYTYTGNAPATAPCDITVVFPNSSENGSGGGLTMGTTVDLGTFPAGTKIGWVLLANAFNSTNGTIGSGTWQFHSNPAYNTMLPNEFRQQSVMFYDSASDAMVLGFEDLPRNNSGTDSDFNDAVFVLKTTTSSAMRSANIEPSVQAGASSSGVYGGLESRLASQVAMRQFVLNMNGNLKIDDPKIQPSFVAADVDDRGGELAKFIPDVLNNSTAKVSTPNDLVNLTNAKEVLAVDYYNSKDRLASILAIESYNGVYEHTKIVCDRLTGAKLVSVREIKIEGKTFTVNQLVQPGGKTEYAISFSAFEESNVLQIENQWSIDQFPKKAQYYNFQIWANAPYITQQLALEVIKKMRLTKKVKMSNEEVRIPKVYVQSGNYQKGILTLDIRNTIKATQIKVSGKISRTETSRSDEDWAFNVPLNGKKEQSIKVKVGKIFDTGILVQNNVTKEADYMYLADGVWGYGLNPQDGKVHSFEVLLDGSNTISDPSELIVERKVAISGRTKNQVSLFRNLLPSGRIMDLRNYREMSFEAEGEGIYEVVISKKSILEWEKQFRTSIKVTKDKQKFVIPMSEFKSIASTELVADDVVSVSLVAKGDKVNLTPFELNVANLKFSKFSSTTIRKTDMFVFPNPTQGKIILEARLQSNEDVSIDVYTTTGKWLRNVKVQGEIGFNRWQLDFSDFNDGIYHLILNTPQEQFIGKFVKYKE